MSKITELVEKLPPDLQEEVLDFIEFIIRKKSRSEEKRLRLEETTDIGKLKGVFNSYADTSKIKSEREAWKSYVVEKWRNARDNSGC